MRIVMTEVCIYCVACAILKYIDLFEAALIITANSREPESGDILFKRMIEMNWYYEPKQSSVSVMQVWSVAY